MKYSIKETYRKIYSSFMAILMLAQSFVPALFVFTPARVYAEDSAQISEVSLSINEDNEFELSVESDTDVPYLITYYEVASESRELLELNLEVETKQEYIPVEKAIMGTATSDGQVATAIEFAGTCSVTECLADDVDRGIISLPKNNFKSEFLIDNGQLWLINNDSATVTSVELNQTYLYPKNNEVKVTFTKLPENPGTLTIKEIILTDDQVEKFGAFSNIAYDITSSMENGSFEYELILPIPEEADEKAGIVYTENLEELKTPTAIEIDNLEGIVVKATGLDHFTVFVVADPTGATNGTPCTVASITGTCYDTLQAAVDAAVDGDTIKLASDITVTQEVTIYNINLVIDGNGNTITSPFVKTSNSNNSAFGVYGSNITFRDLIVDGLGGTNLHGINVYVAEDILLENITVKNYRAGIVVNGSTVTVNNITTMNNSWGGINVDLGGGVVGPAVLTVNGISSHNEASHIWLDDFNKDVSVIDTLGQYDFADFGNTRIYTQNSNPIRDIAFTNTGTPTVGGTNTNIDLEVEATYFPHGIQRVRFRYAPQGETCQQQYTSPYYNNIGDGAKNGDLYSINWDVTGLDSGEYTVCALMHRGSGLGSEGYKDYNHAEFTVSVDNTTPAQPTDMRILDNNGTDLSCEGFTNNRSITIDWSDSPDSDFSHFDYRIREGNIIRHPVVSELSGDIRDEDGYFKYGVRAVDTSGNMSEWSDWCGVTLDREAPEAPALIEPIDNSRVNGAVLLSDWTDVPDSVTYIYESYHDENAANLRWHAEYTESEKTATNVGNATFWWRVKAVDAAGNESEWSELWKVTIDNDAPATPTGLRRNDTAGNEYQCSEYVLRQNMVPVWDENSEADFDHYEYSSFHPSGAQGLDERILYSATLPNNWVAPVDGTYGFAVRAVDTAGNKSAWALTDETLAGSCQINYDSTAPSTPEIIGFLSPELECGAVTNIHNTTVDWSDSIDNGSGFENYEYYIDYPKPDGTRGQWTTSMVPSQYSGSLNEGIHHIKVRAVDALGNTSDWSNTCSITADWTAPETEITTFSLPNNGELSTGSFDGLVEGTAIDESLDTASGISEVLLEIKNTPFGATESSYWNGTAWQTDQVSVTTTGTTAWSYQIPEVSVLEGVYNFTAHAVDLAENIGETYTNQVTYDKTLPEVSLSIDPNSPDGDNGWYITEPTITLSATDNYLVDHIEYQWNSTTGVWTTYSGTLTPPGEGEYTLYYRAIDAVGNISEIGTKIVKYDITGPSEGPLSVRVENIGSTTAIGKWSKPDNDEFVKEYRLSWKSKETGEEHSATVNADTFEHELDNLFDGLWEFRVQVVDDAGNINEATVEFRVGSDPDADDNDGNDNTEEVLGVTTESDNGDGLVAGVFNSRQATTFEDFPEDIAEESEDQESEITEEQESEGEVLGESDGSCSTWQYYLPIILLLLQAIAILSVEITNRDASPKKVMFALAASILTIILFYILRELSCYNPGTWFNFISKWFIPISLGLSLLLKVSSSISIEEK